MFEERQKTSSANFTLYPLLWLAAYFALGILSAIFFQPLWQIYFLISLTSAVFTIVFHKRYYSRIFLFLAFAAAGGLCFQIENQDAVSPGRLKSLYDKQQIKSGDPIEIEGVLKSAPESSVGGFFLEIRADKAIYKNSEIKVSGKVRLFAAAGDDKTADEYKQLNLQYDSKIRVACRLRREDDFLNAGVVPKGETLDQMDIDATGIIKSPLLVEKIEDSTDFSSLGWIFRRRENLIAGFKNNFNVSTAGVLIASLLGNKYFLDKPTADIFREGGTFHVLVISGLHITFIGGLILLFIRLFTKKKFLQFFITCAILWSYSIAVGANVPVVRAALMFTVLLFSQVIYRQGTLLNSLGACCLILLVWRPEDLFTQSFQLTFISVAAIVAFAFPLLEKLRAIGNWSLSAETPTPPDVSVWLKRFCETLYWEETVWSIESRRNVWTANLFKSPYFNWSEQSVLQKILRYFFEAVLVSLVAQICLLPLMIIYFHRVSFAGILLNLWVGIVIALESFAGIFALMLSQINTSLAFAFIKITEFFNWLLISVPRLFVENSWSSFRVPNYSGIFKVVYFLYFLPVLTLVFLIYKWKPLELTENRKWKAENKNNSFFDYKLSINNSFLCKLALSTLTAFIAVVIFHPFSAPAPDGRLSVDFLDVGQGDSALITFPDGETMLVDGGGQIDYKAQRAKRGDEQESELFEPDTRTIGEAVVSSYLWEKGYDKIDYILATHADADHIQGLFDVAKNFRVRAAMFGRMPFKNEEFAAVYEALQKRNVPILALSQGDVLEMGGAKVEVLSPGKDDTPDTVSDNNHSVVLRIIYGKIKILLTGDIEKEAEREILGAPESVRSDVVKVAHHGSRTSSTQEFVIATGAKLAVISVGRTSRFGHPHEEVVERWKTAGAKVLTTGERGTISVSTDGKDLQLKTFLH